MPGQRTFANRTSRKSAARAATAIRLARRSRRSIFVAKALPSRTPQAGAGRKTRKRGQGYSLSLTPMLMLSPAGGPCPPRAGEPLICPTRFRSGGIPLQPPSAPSPSPPSYPPPGPYGPPYPGYGPPYGPPPPKKDNTVLIVVLIIVVVGVVLLAIVLAYLAVFLGGIQGPDATRFLGVNVSRSADGTNWTLTVTAVHSGLSTLDAKLAIFSTGGSTVLPATAFAFLNYFTDGAAFEGTGGNVVRVGDRLLISTVTYPSGYQAQISDSSGLLFVGTLTG